MTDQLEHDLRARSPSAPPRSRPTRPPASSDRCSASIAGEARWLAYGRPARPSQRQRVAGWKAGWPPPRASPRWPRALEFVELIETMQWVQQSDRPTTLLSGRCSEGSRLALVRRGRGGRLLRARSTPPRLCSLVLPSGEVRPWWETSFEVTSWIESATAVPNVADPDPHDLLERGSVAFSDSG